MTDTPQEKKPNPEVEIHQRINGLQDSIPPLEKEIRILEGKLANRKPETVEALKKENDELAARLVLLEKALFSLMTDAAQPRNADDLKLHIEVLRKAAVDYCQAAKIDPDLWKNIES